MSTAPSLRTLEMSVEEYLAAEALSDVRHEYVDGALYAMAGASEAHNHIATNLLASLHAQLRGKPCAPFGSDMKVWVQARPGRCFYYPDAMVACDPADTGKSWKERPAALFEIISEDTRRVDEREKRFVYAQIPTLLAYVRIEQDRALAVIDRRIPDDAWGWRTDEAVGLDAVIDLPELGLNLALADLYERVKFPG